MIRPTLALFLITGLDPGVDADLLAPTRLEYHELSISTSVLVIRAQLLV